MDNICTVPSVGIWSYKELLTRVTVGAIGLGFRLTFRVIRLRLGLKFRVNDRVSRVRRRLRLVHELEFTKWHSVHVL